MKIKSGVQINGVQPETVLAIQIVDGVYRDHGSELVVTSITDGKEWRKHWSLHLPGLAFDCRIWDFVDDRAALEALVEAIADALGPEFDVVLKSDHIHVELDVKE